MLLALSISARLGKMRAPGLVQLLQHAVKTYHVGSSLWAALASGAIIVQYIGLAMSINEVGCDVPGHSTISPALCAIERFFQAMAQPGIDGFGDFDNVVHILVSILVWVIVADGLFLVL